MDVRLAEFHLLRRKAESKTQIDGRSPEAFVAALRMQNAALSVLGKSLVLASVHGGFGFSDAANRMRRSSGPCGGAARLDALTAVGVDAFAVSDKDNEAWVLYWEAERQGAMKRKVERAPRMNKDKVKGGGRILNGFNRRTGVRSRRYEQRQRVSSRAEVPVARRAAKWVFPAFPLHS